ITIPGDGVVAAHPLELVEAPKAAAVRAAAAETGRIEVIGKTGAADRFDGPQRIGADRGITLHDTGREVDMDAGARRGVVAVDRQVETAATIDVVVAAAAFEFFRGARLVVAPETSAAQARPGPAVPA